MKYLKSDNVIEDLPAPVLPTIPIFSPALMWQVTPERTRSRPGLYLVLKLLKLISPLVGQFVWVERLSLFPIFYQINQQKAIFAFTWHYDHLVRHRHNSLWLHVGSIHRWISCQKMHFSKVSKFALLGENFFKICTFLRFYILKDIACVA